MLATLSHTACVLAASRALAFQQGNVLVQDSLAHHFVDQEMIAAVRARDEPVHYVLLRHRRLEDFFVEAARTRSQAVILGAGFDTKFQRYPGLWQRVVEVDSQPMVEYKQKILRDQGLPIPETVIPPQGDPIRQFEIILAATDPRLKTLFLGEGFFMYFQLPHILKFFEMAFHHYTHLPHFGFDMMSEAYARNPHNQAVMRRVATSGERVLTYRDPEIFEPVLNLAGLQTDIWFPTRLARHYLNAPWGKDDDKYVVLATEHEKK